MAVVFRGTDSSERPPQMMLLHGSIDVGTPGDTATLVYTVETVDGVETTAERAGPFTAMGQRVDDQLILPTSE